MIRAYIKNAEEELVGSIDEAWDGFRIWLKERRPNRPLFNLAVNEKLYATLQEASQTFSDLAPGMKII